MLLNLDVHPQLKALLHSPHITVDTLRQLILYVQGDVQELFDYTTGKPFTRHELISAVLQSIPHVKQKKRAGARGRSQSSSKKTNFRYYTIAAVPVLSLLYLYTQEYKKNTIQKKTINVRIKEPPPLHTLPQLPETKTTPPIPPQQLPYALRYLTDGKQPTSVLIALVFVIVVAGGTTAGVTLTRLAHRQRDGTVKRFLDAYRKTIVSTIPDDAVQPVQLLPKNKHAEEPYDGAMLRRVDYRLHTMFKMHTNLNALRKVLLNSPTSVFHGRTLHWHHLVRTDGSIRDSCGEIARALVHYRRWRDLFGTLSETVKRTFRRRSKPRRPSITKKRAPARGNSKPQKASRKVQA